jgi:hypothetical protein
LAICAASCENEEWDITSTQQPINLKTKPRLVIYLVYPLFYVIVETLRWQTECASATHAF